MDVFNLREKLIGDYSSYIKSFITIGDEGISQKVEDELSEGLLWPDPLIQLNPSFSPGKNVDALVEEGELHKECSKIFRRKSDPADFGSPLNLYKHQEDAIRIANKGHNYVLSTGTGSGKSMAYIIPVINHILKNGPGKGIKAILIYPMNALANSQLGELKKFVSHGYPDQKGPISFRRYTGQEKDEERNEIIANPPDILITNYVMLELILTRPEERKLLEAARGLSFVVLDELHTYRGRQGADVAMLLRRLKAFLSLDAVQYVGTSATLSTAGTFIDQQKEISRVASLLFGAEVLPENIVGETLKKTTLEVDINSPAFIAELKARLNSIPFTSPASYAEYVADPLAIWIENFMGLDIEKETNRLIRQKPKSIRGKDGAAENLSALTDASIEECERAIKECLLSSYNCEKNPETGFPPFAFRLHQFISRGDLAYASLDSPDKRHVTLHGQRFVPGSRDNLLYPLVFCRECGQEYYLVQQSKNEYGQTIFEPRNSLDSHEEDTIGGYLCLNPEGFWPTEQNQLIEKLPDDWLEEKNGRLTIKSHQRGNCPQPINVMPNGQISDKGESYLLLQAPFRFCPKCGVTYGGRKRSDFAKLSGLGTEGRSSATTILCLSSIDYLKHDEELKREARKLLSFSDNRQDASLQAGHFNDFVQVGILRSAVYKAIKLAGQTGISHEVLTQKVFESMELPFDMFAKNPEWRFAAKEEAEIAMREMLGYRIYLDLRRGWRIMSPNLEQCGLLEIRYKSLGDLCEAQDVWEKLHPALATASKEVRENVSKTLLDFMRRELAIDVNYLERHKQEQIRHLSDQKLRQPWGIDEKEKMEYCSILFPMSRPPKADSNVYLSPKGGFGQFIARRKTFPNNFETIRMEDRGQIIQDLLGALSIAGLVHRVADPSDKIAVPGYQVAASAFIWLSGDGTTAFHDPIGIPRAPAEGHRTNQFFKDFYNNALEYLPGLEAREHTAQVTSEMREFRESDFRSAKLPLLFCSPTMELGVDISELNMVNLRNVPPTPANYAQRSGRAGRSGQPALVFTYCSTGNSHDQYFFKRPQLMVAGAVAPPNIDLTNEDLLRSHIQAIWLACTGQSLGKTLTAILDLSNNVGELPLQNQFKVQASREGVLSVSEAIALNALKTVLPLLKDINWYSPQWIPTVFTGMMKTFDSACNRWRELYRSAYRQAEVQGEVIRDVTRSQKDRERAKRLRSEAESQLQLLTSAENIVQSDFYSYRYFASEGFLPGYNFPRLPVSAYVAGRSQASGRDEFLSRPRFLAISEFGPRSMIYHEGARYEINRVILPIADENNLVTSQAKRCQSCGYIHRIKTMPGPDLCIFCGEPLGEIYDELFHLQNVSTRRRNKINSDEEERFRKGYEIITGFQFTVRGERPSSRIAEILDNNDHLGTLKYGDAANIWRINLGWTKRANKKQHGFLIDIERGYWEQENAKEEDVDDEDMSNRITRIIPYVEDHRNALILTPDYNESEDESFMATLQAAIKTAIQINYELEGNELAAEPLPSRAKRQSIMFYESSEGGAGVLRRILEDPSAIKQLARKALELCHFNPDTGEDKKRALGSKEDCEAACYDCLMSYGNQYDHPILDRMKIKDYLMALINSSVEASSDELSRPQKYEQLYRLCDSGLEKKWLDLIYQNNFGLPSHAQFLIESCKTKPDFYYSNYQVAVYIDGPPHDFAERHQRDKDQEELLDEQGYTVIRFHHEEDWNATIGKYPNIFGRNV